VVWGRGQSQRVAHSAPSCRQWEHGQAPGAASFDRALLHRLAKRWHSLRRQTRDLVA
jgi:hypothetical protein